MSVSVLRSSLASVKTSAQATRCRSAATKPERSAAPSRPATYAPECIRTDFPHTSPDPRPCTPPRAAKDWMRTWARPETRRSAWLQATDRSQIRQVSSTSSSSTSNLLEPQFSVCKKPFSSFILTDPARPTREKNRQNRGKNVQSRRPNRQKNCPAFEKGYPFSTPDADRKIKAKGGGCRSQNDR